jgi:hypothetical protein
MSNKSMSGQAIVVSAGTPVALGSGIIESGLWIHSSSANTGKLYIGNDGLDTVSSLTGYILDAGDSIFIEYVYDLSTVFVDASVSGEKISWIALSRSRSK